MIVLRHLVGSVVHRARCQGGQGKGENDSSDVIPPPHVSVVLSELVVVDPAESVGVNHFQLGVAVFLVHQGILGLFNDLQFLDSVGDRGNLSFVGH